MEIKNIFTDFDENGWARSYKVEVKECAEPGLRSFDNGVTQHYLAVEAIAKVIEQVARPRDDEDDPALFPDGYSLHQQWNDLADRLYTLLGSQEEAIKFVRTVSVVFPDLLVVKPI